MSFSESFTRLATYGRTAAPARAREVILENTELLATTEAIEAPAGAAVLNRVAELRRRVQQGNYSVDLQQLSSKIIERHLGTKA